MGMTQLIIGTALGFMVAQSGLYAIGRSLGWLQRGEIGTRIRALTPSPGHAVVAGFIRYAAPLGAAAALITLAVWGIGDYMAAKAARNATVANTLDAATAPQLSPSAEDGAAATVAANTAPVTVSQPESGNPYADPEYKVQRRAHRSGSPASLKEELLLRSEAKARAELLQDMQQHARRSQYDCEAADRAGRYLKAGLDVWGFAAWQLKYFPVEGYKGATLAACKDIPNVLDSSQLDLHSTVAQENHS
jgi:hypothetical protein